MILVTGATGTTGSEVVRGLLGRGERVRAMSRRPIALHGAETVVADFDDRASLERALDGVRAVYLVSAPLKPVIDHDAALVEAARAAGVGRIVKLGAISGADEATWHHRSEQPVRESRLDWTVLRPCTFASNMLQFAGPVQHGGTLPNFTGTGAVGVIDPRDIAAVAVQALTTDGHSGLTYTLTGPELLTFADQVAILERTLGTSIAVEDVPIKAARQMLLSGGLDPENVAEIAAGMAQQARGAYAVLTDDVTRILGRAPNSFATWVGDHAHAFRAGEPDTGAEGLGKELLDEVGETVGLFLHHGMTGRKPCGLQALMLLRSSGEVTLDATAVGRHQVRVRFGLDKVRRGRAHQQRTRHLFEDREQVGGVHLCPEGGDGGGVGPQRPGAACGGEVPLELFHRRIAAELSLLIPHRLVLDGGDRLRHRRCLCVEHGAELGAQPTGGVGFEADVVLLSRFDRTDAVDVHGSWTLGMAVGPHRGDGATE